MRLHRALRKDWAAPAEVRAEKEKSGFRAGPASLGSDGRQLSRISAGRRPCFAGTSNAGHAEWLDFRVGGHLAQLGVKKSQLSQPNFVSKSRVSAAVAGRGFTPHKTDGHLRPAAPTLPTPPSPPPVFQHCDEELFARWRLGALGQAESGISPENVGFQFLSLRQTPTPAHSLAVSSRLWTRRFRRRSGDQPRTAALPKGALSVLSGPSFSKAPNRAAPVRRSISRKVRRAAPH